MILRRLVFFSYLTCLMLPIYWLINLSFKGNVEISTSMTPWPVHPTWISRRCP